jgi:hypothetical protein
MRFWTFCTVAAGWLDANFNSVDKKFLHFRTFSIISLLAAEPGVGGVVATGVDAAKKLQKH